MRRRSPEAGFALPLTLFLVAILTLMLTAAFARVETDRRMAETSGSSVSALAVAQSGLHRYMGITAVRPLDGDSTRINVTGGYADVVAHIMKTDADSMVPTLYVLRSTGHAIDPSLGSDPAATHTVAQFAYWQYGVMDVQAAFTAANGLSHDAGDIDGRDPALLTCPGPVVYPPVLSIRAAGGAVNPPGTEEGGTNFAGAAATVADNTNIGWNTLINGGFVPDYRTYTPSFAAPWRSILITGDLTIPSASGPGGAGLLIVTGDLTIDRNNFLWLGVVLVGGRIVFSKPNATIQGAVVSGLNALIPGPLPPAGVTTDAPEIVYAPCLVNQALQSLTGFAPVTNAWLDNWATY